jgi:L-aminopeptidase/D-esterase-like protein
VTPLAAEWPVRVGHWTDPIGLTGCTVVLCPPSTVGSGEVRGGAPGTRETDLLRPGTLVQHVNAVLLAGGSAFGLAAAEGVVRFLEERGEGFDAGVAKVPIVPAAVLFDLGCGDPAARPGPDAGHAAAESAASAIGKPPEEGNVGAGAGATVAKLRGKDHGRKGGLGVALMQESDLVVAALAAVNALGEIVDDDGAVIAGSRAPAEAPDKGQPPPPGNTTLVLVATDAALSKERANLLARAAHDGISRAVRPSHTMWDGDAAFALATGRVEADQRRLESLAVDAVAAAIRRAVLTASSVPGFPAVNDEQGEQRG